MNPQSEPDLDERFQQLEAEINSPPSPPLVSQPEASQLQINNDQNEQSSQSQIDRFIDWFSSLSGGGKLVVVAIAAMVGLVILRAVLKLVAAVISLAVLAALLYIAYQFLRNRSAETQD